MEGSDEVRVPQDQGGAVHTSSGRPCLPRRSIRRRASMIAYRKSTFHNCYNGSHQLPTRVHVPRVSLRHARHIQH